MLDKKCKINIVNYGYYNIIYIFYLSDDLVTPPEETDSKL